MKHLSIPLFTFTFVLHLYASAAVPLKWTVETSRAVPAQFEAYQGETLALEAALQSYGKPLEAPLNYSLYWQTNGMGSAYWSTNVSNVSNVSNPSNLLRAAWRPEYDVGAKVYNCFIGKPGTIYHAAFQLRLRTSPGAIPNELPLPQKVIDFAKVTVLNPPWSGGGGGGVDTNAVRDIIHETVDGAARTLPKYLHALDFDDSYPEAAAEYYRSRGDGKASGGCSAVRDGDFVYRNFDYPFDDRAEFVVKMSAGPGRFASVGVAQVGTNLTEQMVTSGKWSKWYKALPGATVDGINERGVVAEINVVDTPVTGWHTTGDLHPLAAVRWVLDNATNAYQAATYLAENIRFPQGWGQNFHYMIADERETWIVENGIVYFGGADILTNFQLYGTTSAGSGKERYILLSRGANITNAWFTNAYRSETNPPWVSDLSEVIAYTNDIFDAWAAHDKEYFRGKTNNGIPWWQSVHTSIYDITNRTLRICVQEVDDWYTFAVPSAGGVKPEAVREIVQPMIGAATNGLRRVEDTNVYERGVVPEGPWTWSSDDCPEGWLLSANSPEAGKPHFVFDEDVGFWDCGDIGGYRVVDYPLGTQTPESSPSVEFGFSNDPDDPIVSFYATATRPNDMLRPTGDHLAKESQVTPLTSRVAAVESSKRDLTDNTCHKTEGPSDIWTFSDGVQRTLYCNAQPVAIGGFIWNDKDPTWAGGGIPPDGCLYCTTERADVMTLNLNGYGSSYGKHVTATRTAVCTSNELYTTKGYVDGSISTNNPAFVSAVRNTPAPEPRQGEDPPWGTWGTVGAAITGLVAGLAWAKNKIGVIFDNEGEIQDDFATDLLGKQVAINALKIPLEEKTDSFVAEDGHAYAVTMTGTVTITMPTTTEGRAAIFQARFSAAAQQSVQFDTDDVVKFDGTDCGIVKAGKVALLSAMWNGEAWDLVWKNQA